MSGCDNSRVVVIKLGGSVLAREESFRDAAKFLVRRLRKCSRERFVVVVSAQNGHTDQLERVARGVTQYPNPRTLDLLWSTGELRSAALLALHLEELGVSAVALNVHEAGLHCNGDQDEGEVAASSVEVRLALKKHAIVVVPGFFATSTNRMLVSLGRGGSDLSAVLIAQGLDAEECELIKDVDGYFSDDPRVDGKAAPLPQLSYETALKMADKGCELVQRRALEAARKVGLRLVIRGLGDNTTGSVVS
jgi:aspartate kinase